MSHQRQPAPSARPGPAPKPAGRTTEEQVRQRAFQIFMSRQREGVPGDPVTDWLRAEQELRNRRS
jgi:hypothetical protein